MNLLRRAARALQSALGFRQGAVAVDLVVLSSHHGAHWIRTSLRLRVKRLLERCRELEAVGPAAALASGARRVVYIGEGTKLGLLAEPLLQPVHASSSYWLQTNDEAPAGVNELIAFSCWSAECFEQVAARSGGRVRWLGFSGELWMYVPTALEPHWHEYVADLFTVFVEQDLNVQTEDTVAAIINRHSDLMQDARDVGVSEAYLAAMLASSHARKLRSRTV